MGRWSSTLLVGFFVLFGVFQLMVSLGVRGGDTYWDQPLLSIPITLAGLSGVASGVTAGIDMVQRHYATVSGILAVLVATAILVFFSGELLTPH